VGKSLERRRAAVDPQGLVNDDDQLPECGGVTPAVQMASTSMWPLSVGP
jgi:hypothetical protein